VREALFLEKMARDHNGRVIFKGDDGVMREIFLW
jgi:hypothetical protein